MNNRELSHVCGLSFVFALIGIAISSSPVTAQNCSDCFNCAYRGSEGHYLPILPPPFAPWQDPHDECMAGACEGHGAGHDPCGAFAFKSGDELKEFVEAVASASGDELTRIVDSMGNTAVLNKNRRSLQLAGCDDLIIANIPLRYAGAEMQSLMRLWSEQEERLL